MDGCAYDGETTETMSHQHKCGVRYSDLELFMEGEPQGCGFVWEHNEQCRGNAETHMCPQCGRGPWYDKYREGQEDEHDVESISPNGLW